MKSIYTVFVIAILFFACDKKLDIDPTQEIDQTHALDNAQAVKVTLIGAYDALGTADCSGGGNLIFPELVADDNEIIYGGTFVEYSDMWRKTLDAGNFSVMNCWAENYKAINLANLVLSAIDKIDAGEKGQVEGEAKFIRALSYYYLINLYAKFWNDGDNTKNPGVPLVLTPTIVIGEADYKPRASVAEIYTQIIKDLTEAEAAFGSQPDNANLGFATHDAVLAALSRIYLLTGDYQKALTYSDQIIQSGKHQLTTKFENAFNDLSPDFNQEILFKLIVTSQDATNWQNIYFGATEFQGRGDIRITSKHLALYDTNDMRGKFFFESNGKTFTNKFNSYDYDVIHFRLAEQYLIRAECNYRLGTSISAKPVEDLNFIRNRSGANALDENQINLEQIRMDRKLELAFEGLALTDLKRFKKSADGHDWNDPKLIFPIPQRELDINKQLKQNEGY